MTQPLLKHQTGDIEWIHAQRRGLLGNEPGLGKSRSAIEAFDGGRNLVIAPSLVVAGGTWEDELAKWSKDPESWTVATYSMLNDRVKTGKTASSTKPINRLRPEWRGKWDAVVIDEAHYIKGRKTSWTWATEQISRSCGSVLEMTGTPMPNWAHELWSLLRLLRPNEAHPGKPLGSFWRWAGDWFDTSPNRFSNGNPVVGEMLGCTTACAARPPEDPCDHYIRFAQSNLGDQFRQVLRDDALDLPPITEQLIRCEADAKQMATYRSMKKHFMAEIDDDEVLAWSQGSQNVMLDKITVSPWLLNPVGPPKGGKFELLRFDLENRARPTLVLAHYQDVVEACNEVAKSVGARSTYVHGRMTKEEQGRRVRAFKDGKLDVLVGSLETVSEGLTLVVADMAIFVQKSYKPSRNKQATYRVHRMGQTRPVTIREYFTPGTVDERKRKLLATKNDQQMRVLTAAQFKELL